MHRPSSPRKPLLITSTWPRSALLLLCAALLSSCEKKPADPDPVEITIAPENVVLFIGATQQLTALGAVGAVSWSSSSTQIATVVEQTGFVRGVARGEATITATGAGGSGTRVVSVLAPPTLQLSTPTIEFQTTVGGADPAASTVNVTNAGDGSITNLVVGTTAYGAGQPTGWLTATISGATAPATVTLRASAAGLARGTYTAIVPIQAAGLANSPQNIGVTFRIQAPPSIVLSRTTVPVAGIPGDIRTEIVNITNGGDLPLTGLTRTITYTAGQPQGWLQTNIAATTAPTALTLIATIGTLPAGTYTATVQVGSTLAAVTPRDITVQLVVSPGPAIQLAPAAVVVNVTPGTNPAVQTVAVTNSGGGTLSGLSLGTTTYGAGQATGWLNPQLVGTTAPTSVTLTITSAAVPAGTHTATVPVLSAAASNSPQNITVTLTVGQPPAIAVNPGSAVFAAWGGAAAPGAQPIQVTNSGSGTLGGLTTSIAYGSGSGWLTATFQGNNTTAPTTLLLQPNTTALPSGTYSATVTISSVQGGITPRNVPVTYTVQTFSTDVAFHFANCAGCHAHFSGTPANIYAGTQAGGRTIPGNALASPVVCKPFNASAGCNLTHGGGKNFPVAMMNILIAWINAGAPFQ